MDGIAARAKASLTTKTKALITVVVGPLANSLITDSEEKAIVDTSLSSLGTTSYRDLMQILWPRVPQRCLIYWRLRLDHLQLQWPHRAAILFMFAQFE